MNAFKRFLVLWVPALCVAAAAAACTHTVFAAKVERLLLGVPAQSIGRADIALLVLLSAVLAVISAAYPLWARSSLFIVLGLEYYGLSAHASRGGISFLWLTPALVLIAVYYCAGNVLLPWVNTSASAGAQKTGLVDIVCAQLEKIEAGLQPQKTRVWFGKVQVDILAKDAQGRPVMILCQPDIYANTLVKALDLKFFLDSQPEHRIIVLIPHKEEGLKEHLVYFSGMSLTAFVYSLTGENRRELKVTRVSGQMQVPPGPRRMIRRQQRRPARRQPVYDSALTKEEIDHLLGDKV
jgi:hypothetical protein